MKRRFDEELNEIIQKYRFQYEGGVSSTQIHATIIDIFTERCTGKNVAIWGVGKKNEVNSHAAIIIKKYILNLHGLSCLIDSSADIQGTEFMGYPVIAPEELKESGVDIIIIGSRASAKAIAKNIEQVYPGCEYINIYEELAKKGIIIDYNFFSERNMYTDLYDLRIRYEGADAEERAARLKQLIAAYLSIRDFYYADLYVNEYCKQEFDDYQNVQSMMQEIYALCDEIKRINAEKRDNVCVHLIDSLRAKDVYHSEDNLTGFNMFGEYRKDAIAFTNAYSTGPTTYESMLGVVKQKLSFEEDVYDNNNFMFSYDEFALLDKMEKQGKKIVFYVAKDYYIMEESDKIVRKEHLHMSEKLWNVSCDMAESDTPIFGFLYYPWELHYPLLCGFIKNKPQIHHFSDVGIDDMSDFIQEQFNDCKQYVDKQFAYYKNLLGENTINVFLGDHSQPVFCKEHINYPFYMYYNDPDRVSHVAFIVSGKKYAKQDYTDMVSMIDFNVIMEHLLCEGDFDFPKREVVQYQYYNIQNKKMREVAQKYDFWDYTEGIQCFLSKELFYVLTATGKEEVYALKDGTWRKKVQGIEEKAYIAHIKEKFDVGFPDFWTVRVGKI